MTKSRTTKKAQNRFEYMQVETKPAALPEKVSTAAPVEVLAPIVEAPPAIPQESEKGQPVLVTVARGQGRMEQAREQLNVRLPTDLKRRAIAGAALQGLTAGELIERLLIEYLSKQQ